MVAALNILGHAIGHTLHSAWTIICIKINSTFFPFFQIEILNIHITFSPNLSVTEIHVGKSHGP